MVAVKVLRNDSAPKFVPALKRGGLHQPEEISRLCFFSVDMTLPLNSFFWGWALFLLAVPLGLLASQWGGG